MLQAFKSLSFNGFFLTPSPSLIPKAISLYLKIIYLFVVLCFGSDFFVLHTEITYPSRKCCKATKLSAKCPNNFSAALLKQVEAGATGSP